MQLFYKNHLLELNRTDNSDYPWHGVIIPQYKEYGIEFEYSVGCNYQTLEQAMTQTKIMTDQLIAQGVNL